MSTSFPLFLRLTKFLNHSILDLEAKMETVIDRKELKILIKEAVREVLEEKNWVRAAPTKKIPGSFNLPI